MSRHWVFLVAFVASCGSTPSTPAVSPTATPEPTVPTGPEIAVLKPTIVPGQKIELWLRPGPERPFTPSKHDFERKATIEASQTPFGEGGVTAAAILRGALGDPPPESHLPLWAKSLALGTAKVSGSGISVDDDPTGDLSNYVGQTPDGRLVMLLELGPTY